MRVVKTVFTMAVLLVLGTAFSAKADSMLTFTNTQVFYVGPDSTTNPWSLTNSGGDTATYVGMPSTGSPGTLTFNTAGNPGVSLVSNTPSGTTGYYSVQLYGDTSSMIKNGQLATGTYTFNSSSDSFAIGGVPAQTGADPIDYATINVAANGVVTLSSSSLELAMQPTTDAPPAGGAPEIDPATGMSAFTLISGAVLIIRGRRKKLVA